MFNDLPFIEEAGFDKNTLSLMAKEVAEEFLVKGTPLHEKIAHIATESALNKEQIQRVIESTNLTMDNMTGGKDFPVARLEDVLPLVKEASDIEMDNSDYLVGPNDNRDMDMGRFFGIDDQPVESGAIPAKAAIQLKIVKIAEKQKSEYDNLINLDTAIKQKASEIIKIAQQEILDNGETLENLFKMVCDNGHEKVAKKVFPLIKKEMERKGILAMTADESLISDNMNNIAPGIKIINGNEPILKAFGQMEDSCNLYDNSRKNIINMDFEVKKLKEKINQ